MAIKDLGSFQSTLGRADAHGWTRSVDLEKINLDLEGGPSFGGQISTGETKSFGEMLQESIGKVNALQHEANISMEKLASGESENLHETLLAVEQADIAFRTLNQVRSKVIDAYREIMKMQI